MHQIKAQPLTEAAFRKYGTFQNLLDDESLAQNGIRSGGFFPDMLTLNFGKDTLPSVCVCSVQKKPMIIASMEVHGKTCEGLLPIDADVVVYVGIPARNVEDFSVKDCEAFIIPKGTFVRYEPLVMHGTQFPLNADAAHLLCMLPQRTFFNDMHVKRLTDDADKAEIIL